MPTATKTKPPEKKERPRPLVAARVRGSLPDQIEALVEGESISRAVRLETHLCTRAKMEQIFNNMNGTISTAIAAVKKINGDSEYKMERGTFNTQAGHMMLVIVCTCVAKF